jgi:hypothetical protein
MDRKGLEKKAVLAQSRYYLIVFLEGLRKITKALRTDSIMAEIRNEHLQSTSQEHYRYTNLLSSFHYSFT